MPKISVIMPVFNKENYLYEAIDSILNQTITDFELIIINDASKDSSEQVIKQFNDPRIKYFKNTTNKGVSYSTNIGIELAKGEYIAKADSDDIYHPNRLEKQLTVLESHSDINICCSDIEIINKDGSFKERWYYQSNSEVIKAQLLFNSSIANATIMFRSDIFKDSSIRYDENLKSAEDYDFYLKLNNKFTLYHISESLMKYRKLSTGLTGNFEQIKADANIVRKRALEKIGINPTAKEFVIHLALCEKEFNKANLQLNEIVDWLEKIRNANLKNYFYSPNALEEILLKKLNKIVEHFTRNDPSLWGVYWQSLLVKKSDYPEYQMQINSNKLSKNKIAIFGASRAGYYLYNLLNEAGLTIECFIDNDINKKDKFINGIPILSKELFSFYDQVDAIVVSILGNHEKEIIKALTNDLDNEIKILSWKEL